MISAYTASLPTRVSILEKAVKSMLPQVDRIQIVLNNYTHVPDFCRHEKITAFIGTNKLEDGERFRKIEHAPPGYTIVFDDDIIYPADYVKTLIKKVEDYGRVMVCPMGKIMKVIPVYSYYKGILKSFKTFSDVPEDTVVDVPGCCGILWDNQDVKVKESDILIPNSDICMAKFCKDNNVKPVVVAHKADWLTNLWGQMPKDTPSIYGKYKNNDQRLTDFINENL